MPEIIVVTRDGAEHIIAGKAGYSLMETLRDVGIGDLLALCGGSCSCATCHVYVDESFVDSLPPPSEDERDLLEALEHHLPNSRLSCQINITQTLEGLRVTIAAEE